MATQRTRAAGIESGDAPTAEQSIQFDARDRLLGRLDDLPVRRAVEEPQSRRRNPYTRGLETGERRAL